MFIYARPQARNWLADLAGMLDLFSEEVRKEPRFSCVQKAKGTSISNDSTMSMSMSMSMSHVHVHVHVSHG